MEWLGDSATILILIASVTTAIVTIFSNVSLPFSWAKKNRDKALKDKVAKILKDILPEALRQHDLDLRDTYKADRERYLKEIKNEVLNSIQTELVCVSSLAERYDGLQDQYEALVISAKDVLREKIMAVYHKNKHRRALEESEKEALDQYYKDYKAIKGNSYIDRYYGRMKNWEVIPDDYDDSDDE
jgi:ATP-dependent Clp protease ATP-binding subunit ClpA